MNIIMRKSFNIFLIMLLFSSVSLSALTIKLGSQLPDGSSWDRTLKKMALEWSEITGGRVKLKIYSGGKAGGEEDMVRKMRIGQLDAAVLTNVGMTEVVSDSLIFSLPFLVQDENELDYVVDELLPLFDDDFNENGFEVLVWSKSGWITFFSKSQILTPDDLRRTRLACSPNNPEMIEAFKSLGFKVIPLDLNQTFMGLRSGMIDSFYSIPLASATYKWYTLAEYMNPIKISPVIGGIIISERAWRRIPAKYHDELKASMASVEQEFFNETTKLNQDALISMEKDDLTVLKPSSDDEQAWRDLFRDGYWMIVGEDKVISEKTYLEMKERLEAFRNRQ